MADTTSTPLSESEKKEEVERVNKLLNETGDNPEQKTDAWLIQRATLFTASPCCLLVGTKSSFFGTTREEYVDRKTRAIVAHLKGLPLPKDAIGEKLVNKYVHHGTIFEDMATRLFGLMNDYADVFESRLVQNPKFPYLGVSPDGYVIWKDKSECALLEIKCPYSARDIHEVRDYYNDQMQMQMMITDISQCFYFVAVIERSPYNIQPPKAFLADIKEGNDADVPLFGGAVIKPLGSDAYDYERIYEGGFVGKNERFQSYESLLKAIEVDENIEFAIPEVSYFAVRDWTQTLIVADPKWRNDFLLRYGEIVENIILNM